MKASLILLATLRLLHAADDGITWLVRYDGKSLPASPWAAIGKPNAKLAEGKLHLSDDSKDESGAFEAFNEALWQKICEISNEDYLYIP